MAAGSDEGTDSAGPGVAPADSTAPRTPHEEAILSIWRDVLDRPDMGIFDEVFELGGNSLHVIAVAARIRQTLGISVRAVTFFEFPTVAELASAVAAAAAPIRPVIGPRPPDAEPVLSYDQERLWLEDQLLPGAAYNVGGQQRLVGPLDVSVLEDSLRVIIGRHEALRTRFPVVDGQPVQVVDDPDEGWRLPVEDLREAGAGKDAAAAALLLEHAATPFDLARGPLLRVVLVRLSDTEHLLGVAAHHIVCDATSISLFVRELSALYGAGGDALRAGLPELPVQYRDFAVWQRGWLAGQELERQVDYWRSHLAGAPPALALPAAAQAPSLGAAGGRIRLALSPEQTAALGELCRRQDVTLFMLMLAALSTVLGRWSGQRDVVTGVSVSNRTDTGTENLIGCFINTLPLRVDLSGDPTFTDLLGRVREVALGAYAHADAPLDLLVRELKITRDPRRTPLFQVLMNILDRPADGQISGVEAEVLDMPAPPAKFDLALTAREFHGALLMEYEFSADRYQAAMMEVLAGQVGSLLGAVAADPDRGILDYPLRPGGPDDALEATGPQAGGPPDAAWAVRRFGLGPGDRVAVLSGSPAHRVAAAASAQGAGAALVSGEPPLTAGATALADWLRASEASVVYLTPPLLRTLSRSPRPQLPALRYVFVENFGELLSHDVTAVRRLSAACRCVALYRVLPDGTPSAAYLVPEDYQPETAPPRVPLGRELGPPARLLHLAGQPAAVGEVAEICFGTSRTGDLGRRWADGTLEYVSPLTHAQTGPFETLAALRAVPEVDDAVVIERTAADGQPVLLGYVTGPDPVLSSVSAAMIRHQLATWLAERLLPRHLFVLDQFPLTPDGHYDLDALPEPIEEIDYVDSYVAPRTPMESQLAEIISELLALDRVGVYQSFFEMGGFSLLATRLTSRIRDVFHIELTLRQVFESPTIDRLAQVIVRTQGELSGAEGLEALLNEIESA